MAKGRHAKHTQVFQPKISIFFVKKKTHMNQGVSFSGSVDQGPNLREAVGQEVDLREAVDQEVDLREAVDQEVELGEAVDQEVELGEAVDQEVELGEAVDQRLDLSESVDLLSITRTGQEDVKEMCAETRNLLLDAKCILTQLGIDNNEVCGYVLIALAGLKPGESWAYTSADRKRPKDIIEFLKKKHNKVYAENSREILRKKALHHFEDKMMCIKNSDNFKRCTNSPNTNYVLTDTCLELLSTYGSVMWSSRLEAFLSSISSVKRSHIELEIENSIKLIINGKEYLLSPGKHNELIRAVILDYLPKDKFKVLYLGDTASAREHERGKFLIYEKEDMKQIGLAELTDKLPDIIAYIAEKNMVIFIEVVNSCGAITDLRYSHISKLANPRMTNKFLTVFPTRKMYNSYGTSLASDTSVWINEEHEKNKEIRIEKLPFY